MRLTGDGQKGTLGFVNGETGVVRHEAGELLNSNTGGAVFNNGLWEISGGASLTGTDRGTAYFRNQDGGTLRKVGNGTATIGNGTTTNGYHLDLLNSSLIEVQGGTLLLNSGHHFMFAGSELAFSGGGQLQIGGPGPGTNTILITDTLTGRGDGAMVLNSGDLRRYDTDNPTSVIDFRGGSFLDWRGGSLSNLTNAGQVRLTGGGQKGTLGFVNGETGVVRHEAGELLNSNTGGAVFNNGLWEISGGASLTGTDRGTAYFRNQDGGTLRKVGNGTATIGNGSHLDFVNYSLIEVLEGTLAINSYQQVTGELHLDGGQVAFGSRPDITGGTITGSGTITGDVSNSGATVRPGNSPGTLTIDGDYSHGPDARLVIEIAPGNPEGDSYLFDVLDVTGLATLTGGALEIVLLPGDYSIPMLTQFDVLRAGTLVGSFSEFILPTDALGVPLFAATADPLTGVYTLTALRDIEVVPEPGALAVLALSIALLPRRRVA